MTKKKTKQTFGQLLREKRVAKGISLRKFATLVDVSPTYISQIEQDNIDPPTADRVKRMAELLGENVDEWTALAGRLAEDLPEIIRESPTALPDLLRAVRSLNPEQLLRLREVAEEYKVEKKKKKN